MKTMKVLLVDDKSENLLALESLLKADAVEFHRATSGVEALELLLVQEYALAILDVQMPEMDGFELAELMRGTQQTRSVPIIFVTAGTRDQMNTFRGYDKGAVDFMYKPLDPHVVRSKVQVFLELARQRQLLQQQLTQTQQALKERDQALRSAHEALHTRDEFMSIASHELKTPLTSLHLQIQMMSRTLMRAFDGTKDDSLPISRLMQGLEVCERQSGKLSSLLDELLDLTRVRLGKLNLAYSEVNLSDLVPLPTGKRQEGPGDPLRQARASDLRHLGPDSHRADRFQSHLQRHQVRRLKTCLPGSQPGWESPGDFCPPDCA